MDRITTHAAIRKFIDGYSSARYRGYVFSVNSEKEFSSLRHQISAVLLDYEVWSEPGLDGAPSIPCSRREFNEILLSKREHSIVLVSPYEWMIDWAQQDRDTFWSGIADTFGRQDVCVLVVNTPSINRVLEDKFTARILPGTRISVWLSKHQPVSGYEELFV